MPLIAARYREFAPCEALRPHVRAFFSSAVPPEFGPAGQVTGRLVTREILFPTGQPFWSSLFADGHVSMVFSFGPGYSIEGLWHPRSGGPGGHVIGAMRRAQAASHGERLIQVGAYFRAASSSLFTRMPASQLTDRAVALGDLWGESAAELEDAIRAAAGDAERVTCLERGLLRLMAGRETRRHSLDMAGLTAAVLARRGRLSVGALAASAGVSRQYLTKVFREAVGATPKLYCRVARFKAALAFAGLKRNQQTVDWADLAIKTGYADQSHMIADFRQFSGLTPEKLVSQRVFHPFMEHAARAVD